MALAGFAILSVVAASDASNSQIDAGFGRSFCSIGDVDRDGCTDVAIGSARATGGVVYVQSGSDGRRIGVVDFSRSSGQYDFHVGRVDDFDGDGCPELAVATRTSESEGNEPRIEIVSPATRAVLGVLRGNGAEAFVETKPIGDVDGDGRPDLIAHVRVDAIKEYFDRYVVFSIATYCDVAISCPSLGDVDRDGRADFAVVVVYSGRDGRILSRFGPLPPLTRLGFAIASLPDVDGDGGGELVVTAHDPWIELASSDLFVVSARTGRRIGIARGNIYATGWRIDALADADGDGFPDYAASRFVKRASLGDDQGVLVFCGRSGRLLQEWTVGSLRTDGR